MRCPKTRQASRCISSLGARSGTRRTWAGPLAIHIVYDPINDYVGSGLEGARVGFLLALRTSPCLFDIAWARVVSFDPVGAVAVLCTAKIRRLGSGNCLLNSHCLRVWIRIGHQATFVVDFNLSKASSRWSHVVRVKRRRAGIDKKFRVAGCMDTKRCNSVGNGRLALAGLVCGNLNICFLF